MIGDEDERVHRVVIAFLGFLEGEGEEPSLDEFDQAERTEVEEVIRLLVATRGVASIGSAGPADDPVAIRLGYAHGRGDRDDAPTEPAVHRASSERARRWPHGSPTVLVSLPPRLPKKSRHRCEQEHRPTRVALGSEGKQCLADVEPPQFAGHLRDHSGSQAVGASADDRDSSERTSRQVVSSNEFTVEWQLLLR